MVFYSPANSGPLYYVYLAKSFIGWSVAMAVFGRAQCGVISGKFVGDNKLCSSLSFSYYLLEAYILITAQLPFATKTLMVIIKMTVHSLINKGLPDNLHKGRKYE